MEQKPVKSYYTDALTNYLIIHCPASALEGYQYRMLAVNRIHGLLPCSMRGIDGETYLYYDITSRQSLARRYDHEKVSGKEMKQILYAVCRVFQTLADYLLDSSRIFLDPEYIFYDLESEEFCFTYYPEKIEENSLARFIEFLADNVDPGCAEAVAVIYRLCDLAIQPGFVLREELLDHEFETVLLQDAVAQEQTDPRGLSSEKDPDLRVNGTGRFDEPQEQEDDLLWDSEDREEKEQKKKEKQNRTKKHKKTKKRKEKGEEKTEKLGPGKILILAIIFLSLAGGLWVFSQRTALDSSQLIAARAGVITGLTISLILAVCGLILIARRNKEDEKEEAELREEGRRNAMMPSAEYPHGKP